MASLNGLTSGVARMLAIEVRKVLRPLNDVPFQQSLQEQDLKQNEEDVSPGEVAYIGSLIDQTLQQNPDCASLISEAFRLLGSTMGIRGLFDTINGMGTIKRIRNTFQQKGALGWANFGKTLNRGPVQMHTAGITYYNHGYGYGNPVVEDEVLITTIHELFHINGGDHFAYHIEQAEVLNQAAINLGLGVAALPQRKDYPNAIAYEGAMMNFFDQVLRQHCTGRPVLRRRE